MLLQADSTLSLRSSELLSPKQKVPGSHLFTAEFEELNESSNSSVYPFPVPGLTKVPSRLAPPTPRVTHVQKRKPSATTSRTSSATLPSSSSSSSSVTSVVSKKKNAVKSLETGAALYFWYSVVMIMVTVVQYLNVTYRVLVNPAYDLGWEIIEFSLDFINIAGLVWEAKNFNLVDFSKHSTKHPQGRGSAWVIYSIAAAIPTGCLVWLLFGGMPYPLVTKFVGLCCLGYRFDVVIDNLSLVHQMSPLVTRLLQNILFFLGMTHTSACCWYMVLSYETGRNSNVNALLRYDFNNANGFTLYLTGVEWSIKHLCGYGSLSVFPESDVQTALMLGIAIAGLAMYTSLLGTVSTLITDMSSNSAQARLAKKLDEVTDSLASMSLPKSLQEECKKYYLQVFKVAGTVGATSLLDDLPEDLQYKVSQEMARATFAKVPIFRNADTQLLDRLMVELVPKVFLEGIDIIKKNDIGAEMLILQSGELHVKLDNDSIQVLLPGSHFGELALVTNVKRDVTVTTASPVMLFVLPKWGFEKCLLEHPTLGSIIDNYIRENVEIEPDESKEGFITKVSYVRRYSKGRMRSDVSNYEERRQSLMSMMLQDDGITLGSFLFGQSTGEGGKAREKPSREGGVEKPGGIRRQSSRMSVATSHSRSSRGSRAANSPNQHYLSPSHSLSSGNLGPTSFRKIASTRQRPNNLSIQLPDDDLVQCMPTFGSKRFSNRSSAIETVLSSSDSKSSKSSPSNSTTNSVRSSSNMKQPSFQRYLKQGTPNLDG